MTKKEFLCKYGKILLPLVTPFGNEEEVNYPVYEELIEYLIKNNACDSFVVTGTTGEASLCTFDERIKLMETALRTSKSRKPIIAGTGCASTKETIALTREAESLGIDLCLIVAPFYNKPTQNGLIEHYKAIAASSTVNILLYNIPVFVGVNIEPATVAELATVKNIIGIKDEAGANPTQITDFFLATEEINPEFVIFNGDDIMLLPTIIQGATGIVSGGAHIFGHEIREIFKAFERGDNKKAKELFVKIYRFCKVFGQGGRILPNPVLRPAIELVTGINVGPGRHPLSPITVEERQVMTDALRQIGKL
jgi:4-hydroxy-tetrahydrodipicolinate synthase